MFVKIDPCDARRSALYLLILWIGYRFDAFDHARLGYLQANNPKLFTAKSPYTRMRNSPRLIAV